MAQQPADQYRAELDFEITLSGGGTLRGRDFRIGHGCLDQHPPDRELLQADSLPVQTGHSPGARRASQLRELCLVDCDSIHMRNVIAPGPVIQDVERVGYCA